MRMKKLFPLFLTSLLLAVLLTGCGQKPASSAASVSAPSSASAPAAEATAQPTADLDGVFASVLAANPISNPFELGEMDMEYDFMIAKEDLVAYKGVRSNDNGDAGCVLVIETPEGRADAVSKSVQEYLDAQIAYWGNYAEFAQAQQNAASAVVSVHQGRLVVLAVASNECTGGLEAAVSAALAG